MPRQQGKSLSAARWMATNAGVILAIVVLLGTVVIVFAGEAIAPYDPAEQSLAGRLTPPVFAGGTWEHVLGTDSLGRDVLSRVLAGARSSMIIAVSVTVIAGVIGSAVGIVAGYFGGRTDRIITRIIDVQFAFPGLLLALTIIMVLGPSTGALIFVLSLLTWMVFARMARASTVSVCASPHVEVAHVLGCGHARIVLRHVVPNLLTPLGTLAVLEFARVLVAESGLSFLGLGVQPPAVSWGLDIATGREFLFSAWWLVTFPGLAITTVALGANIVVNWSRVHFDPDQRDRRFQATLPASAKAANK